MIGKVFVLCLVIFGVMAFAPEGEKPARVSARSQQISQASVVSNADKGQKPDSGDLATQDREITAPVPQTATNPMITTVSFNAGEITPINTARPAPEPRHLGTLDAPPEARARMQALAAARKAAAAQDDPVQNDTPQTGTRYVYVTAKRVNLRAGPSTRTAILGRFKRGTKAEVISQSDNGWAEIRDVKTGLQGFMSSRFLSTKSM